MPVLYAFGQLFLLIAFNLFGYRKKVVTKNLKRSFPSATKAEIAGIRNRFYRHLSDVFAEGLKGYSIKRKNLLSRFYFTNPELVNHLTDKNKSVILVGAHYNNWEFLVLGLDLFFHAQGTGVGQKISSKSFSELMKKVRSRFGMQVWTNDTVRQNIQDFKAANRPFVCLLLADQSPSDVSKSLWLTFLNQATPVIFGPEYLAKKFDLAVVFYRVEKVKRGYYQATLSLITEQPTTMPEGEITRSYIRLLEQEIQAKPEYWLWSHKRWKHRAKAPKA